MERAAGARGLGRSWRKLKKGKATSARSQPEVSTVSPAGPASPPTEASLPDEDRMDTSLESMSEEMRADKDIVIAAVQRQFDALRHASPALRADRDVVMAAVGSLQKDSGSALEHASEELRADKSVVLAAVRTYPDALKWASPALRGDRAVVLAAIYSPSSLAFKYASRELRADRDMALLATIRNRRALHFASDELRVDEELSFFAGWGGFPSAMRFLNQRRRADRDFMLEAIRVEPSLFAHASEELREDEDFVLLCAKRSYKWGFHDIYEQVGLPLRQSRSLEDFLRAGGSSLAVRGQQIAPILSVSLTQTQTNASPEVDGPTSASSTGNDSGSSNADGSSNSRETGNGNGSSTTDSTTTTTTTTFVADAFLPSGRNITCEVPVYDGSPEPTVDVLAAKLVEMLRSGPEGSDTTDVFLVFATSDDEWEPVSIWDCDRSLRDFLLPDCDAMQA